MLGRLHLFVVFGNLAVGRNDEGLPLGHGHAQHPRLDAIGIGRVTVDIREQRKRQRVVFRKLAMRFDIVETDTQDLGIEAFKLSNVLLKRLKLARSNRSEVSEIEGKHHVLLATVLEQAHRPLR